MRGDRLLWLLLLGLFGGVVVLAVHHEQGHVGGLDLDQFGSLVGKLAIAIFVGAFAWSLFRGRIGESLMAAAFWVVLAAFLSVAYTYRDPLRSVADKVIGQLVPGYAARSVTGATVTVEVTQSAGGEFAVRAAINGASVPMLVDTGATSVVLTHAAAQAAGLPLDFLTYDVPVETANGRTRAAAVVIDNIIVGGIVERRVPALISAPGVLRTSLLGMSFLSRLDGFEFRGDTLILRGAPAAR